MPTDYNLLRLKAAGNPARLDEIFQAECRERCRDKLHMTLRCPDFRFPTPLSAEQCTGDTLAMAHSLLVPEGATVLDMTCGLGIDTFHIARRASHVTAIDLNPLVADTTRRNAAVLGLHNVDIMCANSVAWLTERNNRFDCIFIDPSRRAAGGTRLYRLSQCTPDVTAILPMLLSRCDRLIIKASPMLDVSLTATELCNDADIIIYGDRGECRELVAVLPGKRQISVNIDGDTVLEFNALREHNATPSYTIPRAGQWLHEPWAPVVKAAPFRLLSSHYGLSAIDPNTHLYVGNAPVRNFPGSIRPINRVLDHGKKAIAHLGTETADIAVRNFVMSAQELRRFLGIRQGAGGLRRIIGVRAGSRKLLLDLGPSL